MALVSTPRTRVPTILKFFGSFSVIYGSPGVIGDLALGFLSWGYTFGLLALAVMLLALLAYAHARTAASPPRGRTLALPGLLGALASLLHPWQGELLILIILLSELVLWRPRERRSRSIVVPAVCIAATGLPLLYYAVLGQADPSWHLARIASKHSFPLTTVILAMAPLVLMALPAYRGRSRSFLELAIRCWPPAALAIYVISATDLSATPLHAFEGVTVPLAVLAVTGARRMGLGRQRAAPLVASALVVLATVPAAVYLLHAARSLAAPSVGNPNFIAADERRALEYLARDHDPGGVLTRFYLGTVVPGLTGRRTFVGDCLWSQPRCGARAQLAELIFDDSLPDYATREFVRETGARFVLADCADQTDMDRVLAPNSSDVRHFGCAAVYELTAASSPDRDLAAASAGPLAESPPHAALRASGRQQRGVQSS